MKITKFTHACVRLEHEGQLDDRGLDAVDSWFDEMTDHGYRRPRPFEQA
ncbi:hypothetical protein [Umezawaea sp. NPDC059074]